VTIDYTNTYLYKWGIEKKREEELTPISLFTNFSQSHRLLPSINSLELSIIGDIANGKDLDRTTS